ncbi:unnamed protein product [Didymodactylos carnosus]|uniref:Uncharacterized protein n=1 Tax=Didymodactylos carnosus TaxID=1234261 RepID=A0A814K234_9BILA|nr:unnamed protein product [Didymodactylos carnosus]CAF1045139.1 unnamed protein product [Didymodactylos carnosus]CAF3682256.1 unnamed protein product [Didymodactylos carnosus]CAF3815069.1 unnamed protein product [Didymodactylos carnosus]
MSFHSFPEPEEDGDNINTSSSSNNSRKSDSDTEHVCFVSPSSTTTFIKAYTFNKHNEFVKDYDELKTDPSLRRFLNIRPPTIARNLFKTSDIVRQKLEKLSLAVGKCFFLDSNGTCDFTSYRITPIIKPNDNSPSFFIAATCAHPYLKTDEQLGSNQKILKYVYSNNLSAPTETLIFDDKAKIFEIFEYEKKIILDKTIYELDQSPNANQETTNPHLATQPWRLNDFLFIKVYDEGDEQIPFFQPTSSDIIPQESVALIGYPSGVEDVFKYEKQGFVVKFDKDKNDIKEKIRQCFGNWQQKICTVGEIRSVDDPAICKVRPHDASAESGMSGCPVISLNLLFSDSNTSLLGTNMGLFACNKKCNNFLTVHQPAWAAYYGLLVYPLLDPQTQDQLLPWYRKHENEINKFQAAVQNSKIQKR